MILRMRTYMFQVMFTIVFPRMMLYASHVATRVAIRRMTLRHGLAAPKLGSVTDVEKEAAALARSARRHLDAYNEDMEKIEKLLPALRTEADLGPKAIEELILGLRDRGHISRKTAAAAGTSRKVPADQS